MMNVAYEMARRTTCLRRGVGCVLTNKYNHILSTGYNGVAKGEAHCNEGVRHYDERDETTGKWPYKYINACPGASATSGSQLDDCYALHSEWNALLQCRDPQSIERAYITTSPCITCVKLLLNTSCEAIYFVEPYLSRYAKVKDLWIRGGRQWMPMKDTYNNFYANQQGE
jgi:dCMP deaminase